MRAPDVDESRWLVPAVLGIALVAIALLLHPRRARDVPAASRDLVADVAGCDEILRGPVCTVAPGSEIRLWVPSPATAILTVTTDGRELPATTTAWPDGRTLRVTMPKGARVLAVHARSEGHAASWSIPIAAPQRAPAAIESAIKTWHDGKPDEAAALLARALDASSEGRDSALSALASIDYRRGHIEEAIAHYHEAIALRESLGRSSKAAWDLFSLAFLLIERNRLGEAAPLIAHAAELSREYAEGRGEVAHYEGRLAWRRGDLRLALRRTRDAERTHERLGSARFLMSARLGVALLLRDLGRTREAIAVYQQLLDKEGASMSACTRARYLDGLGYLGARLTDEEPGAAPGFDPLEPLHTAIGINRTTCDDPNELANALHDVAHVELARGHLGAARAALDEARRVARSPRVDVILESWHLLGLVELAASAPAKALAAFEREDAVAAALGASDDQRLAAEDRAFALVALGRARDALAAVQAADAIVDAGAAFIPLGEGKDTFLGSRDRAATLEVALLAELGRIDEAVAAASRVGSRLLMGLRAQAAVDRLSAGDRARWDDAIGRYRAARDTNEDEAAHEWELSADRLATAVAKRKESAAAARTSLDDALAILALPEAAPDRAPSPPPGALELLYFPLPEGKGWLGFAREAGAPWRVERLGAIDLHATPGELARKTLAPFDRAIARATRVRVRLYGAMRGVDVHALPWRGDPLIAHASVEYALALSDLDAAPLAPGGALVVADPRGDLPSARAEADAVEHDLSPGAGWHVEVLRGGAASGEAVRASLAGASLLHYAGHATFGGPDGVESALALAGRGELTPTDILALPHVPALVSLFGCDTGRESASGKLDALGLANAFLAAGARTVIATSRPVDDALARDVAASFYATLAASPQLSPAAALRSAALHVRSGSPSVDWAAFRALVR